MFYMDLHLGKIKQLFLKKPLKGWKFLYVAVIVIKDTQAKLIKWAEMYFVLDDYNGISVMPCHLIITRLFFFEGMIITRLKHKRTCRLQRLN